MTVEHVTYGKGRRLKLMEFVKDAELVGSADDDAIICTPSQTFIVKEVDSSNTMLLLNSNGQIDSVLHSYYELIPTLPDFSKLRIALNTNKQFNLEELCSLTQSSKAELETELKEQNVFIDGTIATKFSLDYVFTAIEILIANAELNEWDFDCLSISDCYNSFEDHKEDFPFKVFIHILGMIGQVKDNKFNICGSKLVCVVSRKLLHDRFEWDLSEFMQKLKNIVPEKYEICLEDHPFIAIVEESVHYINVDLPEESIVNRMFSIKPKWDSETALVKSLSAKALKSLRLVGKHFMLRQ